MGFRTTSGKVLALDVDGEKLNDVKLWIELPNPPAISGNRAYRETAAPGVVFLYTGGWPGRAERLAIGYFAAVAERVLHWGDIDMAGAAIADAVWQAAGRDVELHLMTQELARKHGQPATFRGIEVAQYSPARDLVTWLSGPNAHALEQEEIDPLAFCSRG